MVRSARLMLSFTFTPERAWHEAARNPACHFVGRYLGLLALVPAGVAVWLALVETDSVVAGWLTPLAYDSPFATAMGGAPPVATPVTPLSAHGSPVIAAKVAFLTYAGVWLAVASGAAVLNLLLPLFSAHRDLRRALMLASYAATPVLLSSVTLLHPSLAAIIALALMHSSYVAYLGLHLVLGVPRSEAGICLGIATIAALLFGQIVGYGAGLLMPVLAH
ncbi:MAG: YIP1 family protein [Rhodospirillaceae bacterium]